MKFIHASNLFDTIQYSNIMCSQEEKNFTCIVPKNVHVVFWEKKGMNNKTNLQKWWCVFAGGKVGLCRACSYTLYSNIIHAVTLECGSLGLLAGYNKKNFFCVPD